MSGFEQHIRKLTLREPGDTLDQRVLSSLQCSVEVVAGDSDRATRMSSGAANARLVNSPPMNESTQIRRGIFSGTISGFVAALVIGMAIGNGLPSVWSRSGDSLTNGSSAIPADGGIRSTHDADSDDLAADSGFPGRHPMVPDLSQHLRDALQNQSGAGSQFVESSYLAAVAGASRWERQNSEKFNVTTHVSDRRFDMCRECHRVGG